MAKRATTDLSLALVDVVTNGLASVLVLFFLLTMLRAEVTWTSTLSETRGPSSQAIDPLLIIVTAPAGTNVFTVADSPWSKEAAGAECAISHGPNYATFFAGDAPHSPHQVLLTLPPDHPGCDVQIMHGKRQLRSTLEPGASGTQVLWPPADAEALAEEDAQR